MASFSPTEAAFEGFRITREQPRVVLALAACSLAFSFLLGVVAFVTLGPEFASILTTVRSPTLETKEFWRVAASLWPFLLVAAPAALLFQAVLNCAIYRMILRPEDRGWAYIRLGADELRVAAVMLVYAFVWVFVLFLTMMTAIFGGAFGGPVAAFAGSVLSGVVCFYCVIVLVRLSLAAPISFSERRLTLLKSWSVTKGRFWSLLGTYVLAFVFGLLIFILMWLMFGVVELAFLAMSGASLSEMYAKAPSPAIFVAGLFSQAAFALILTCYRLIMESPPAAIYKAISERTPPASASGAMG